MNILFITGSFERGKDGVADYTFTLAKECIRLGATCSVLAWNDRGLDAAEDTLLDIGEVIAVRRLPSPLPTAEKELLGKEFVSARHPDVVSIQMVSFGYHPRGWIFGLGESFKKIIPKNCVVQLMLHELWLGLASNHPMKEKLYGSIQKRALQGFWNTVKPHLFHVSNNVHYSKLLQLGLSPRYLPLLSNIPANSNPDFSWIYPQLGMSKEQRENTFVLLMFGSIHPGWNISAFMNKVQSYARPKNIVFLSVGSQGYGSSVWDNMTEHEGPHLRFVKLGFRTNGEISDLLHFSDLGITTNTLSLLGKSGTAMAMIEHGLPIVATRDELKFPFTLQKIEDDYPHAFIWEELDQKELAPKILPTEACKSKIAGKFLADLQHVINNRQAHN